MRFRVPELFLGCFLTVAVFASGMLFSNQFSPAAYHRAEKFETPEKHGTGATENDSNKTRNEFWASKSTDWMLSLLTFFLVLFTYRLWRSTDRLWQNAETDTRTLQRAYLSVVPLGLKPFQIEPRYSCDVGFYNSGNLPATDVSWFISREFDTDPRRKNFPIDEGGFEGSIIVPQRVRAPKGALGVVKAELEKLHKESTGRDRWIYVWGQVRYLDGFGKRQRTTFCHRYNLAAFDGNEIKAESARYHEYGNDAE